MGLWDTVKSVGAAAAPFIGGAVGGPAGAALGGVVGNALGGAAPGGAPALSSQPGQPPPPPGMTRMEGWEGEMPTNYHIGGDPNAANAAAQQSEETGAAAQNALNTLATGGLRAGQEAAGGIEQTGAEAQQYGQRTGADIADYGTQAGDNLAGAGSNLVRQGADVVNRGDVGGPNFGAVNASLGEANRQNYDLANRELAQAQGDFGQANQYIGGAGPDFSGANQAMAGAAPDFSQQNASLAGATPQFGAQDQTLARSTGYEGDLTGIEAQEGPSAAQAQLQSGLNRAKASALSLARSARGFGGSASALSQAGQQNAVAGQEAVNASATLRAQEDAARRQRQAQNLNAAAGLAQSTAGQQFQQQGLSSQLAMQKAAQQFQQQGMSAELAMQKAQQLMQQQGMSSDVALRQGGMMMDQQSINANLAMGRAGMLGNQTAEQAQRDLQTAGIYMGQQELGSQVALQNQSMRDAQQLGLTGMGLGAQAQGAGIALQGQGMGADLGMQGYGMGIGAQQGAAGLMQGAYGQAGQLTGAGAGLALGGQAQGFEQQQQAVANAIAYQNQMANLYGIDVNANANRAQMAMQESQFRRSRADSYINAGIGALGSLAALSDERAKTDIEPADSDAIDLLDKAPAYSYRYTDPDELGAAPGRHVGPMAQDLEKSEAGARAVVTLPNGRKIVDTGRLTLALHGSMSATRREFQSKLSELEAKIDELSGKKKERGNGRRAA